MAITFEEGSRFGSLALEEQTVQTPNAFPPFILRLTLPEPSLSLLAAAPDDTQKKNSSKSYSTELPKIVLSKSDIQRLDPLIPMLP